MKIIDTIDCFIPGDWGNETLSEEAPCKVSCIRGADIVPIENNDFSHIPTRYISQQSFDTKCLQAGDIIVEKSGGSPTQSTGRVSFISQELIDTVGSVVCSNFCVAFRVKQKWNPLYIYYYLQHVYNNGVFFNFEGKTSGIKNLQLEAAYNAVPIEEVNKATQDSVVSVLDSIQKKMTINRQINQNLEALAKQLYDYWFVQFDFPNEEGKPYKSSGGAMAWNEKLKRDIPASWKTVVVDDVAEVFNGATPSTGDEQNYGGDIVWITPKDLSDQKQKFVYQGERNISQAGYDSCSTHLLPINTVLMSSRAPIGLLAIAKKELCTNQGFKSFVPKEDRIATYLYYYLQFHIKQIEQLGTGTTFKEVSREDVLKFPILKPKDTILDLWEKRVSALNDRQLELQKENENLSKQRDELLPLLMNGQVSLNSDLSHD
ncbi:restriction endonuclease subunit S [Bacteroides thetaiotaomicron]|nr:restriction endonuclease subunit S [Bacteroides thetaiotaomicron]KAB4624417.1 restriction endonuclease subunit S [Bacteroides thetaiotaomicron]KAB4688255.1 restriction endonuclease subunit S [Bacteroides thetaiotaomicron]KAB4760385.1 restriction endonuclease subunit S [Bacteroides thetaiotaomicron]KAB4760723.1 restriction endonuclease subunit S [Bacteroides thetaiotaomicron]